MPNPHICKRCAASGPTCCTVAPGHEEYCFPLSPLEMERIAASGPQDGRRFVHELNSDAFVTQLAALLPEHDVRTVFPPGGHHWRLATTADGRCIFLGETGCILDRDVRPFYCQLFPLWSYHGRLTWFTAEECLAHKECASLAAMLTAMHTQAQDARQLFDAMCAGLKLGKKIHPYENT